ncbi:MAG TPA: pyrroloquinoline quinone biosynthesis peptide chaperone PqqD [Alphaproteobacteria bacterium]|nr:pyrroloquinoline quinone biosynthesis peptide chaperone PqqD [Alphaproteobacteria bacterium]
MTERTVIQRDSVPRLAAHTRLRFDKARDSWTIQAPERSFMLDAIAHAIVSRCDGAATVEAIVGDLCRAFEGAPRDVIETDVLKLIQDFADKGVMAA